MKELKKSLLNLEIFEEHRYLEYSLVLKNEKIMCDLSGPRLIFWKCSEVRYESRRQILVREEPFEILSIDELLNLVSSKTKRIILFNLDLFKGRVS